MEFRLEMQNLSSKMIAFARDDSSVQEQGKKKRKRRLRTWILRGQEEKKNYIRFTLVNGSINDNINEIINLEFG